MKRLFHALLALATAASAAPAASADCSIQLSGGELFTEFEVLDRKGRVIEGLAGKISADPVTIRLSETGAGIIEPATLVITADEVQLRFEVRDSRECKQALRMPLPIAFRPMKERVMTRYKADVPIGFSRVSPPLVEAQLEVRSRTKEELSALSLAERQTLARAAFNVLVFADNLARSSSGALSADSREIASIRQLLGDLVEGTKNCPATLTIKICRRDYAQLATSSLASDLALRAAIELAESEDARTRDPEGLLRLVRSVHLEAEARLKSVAGGATALPASASGVYDPCRWIAMMSQIYVTIARTREWTPEESAQVIKTSESSQECASAKNKQPMQDAAYLQTLLRQREARTTGNFVGSRNPEPADDERFGAGIPPMVHLEKPVAP